jgi:hypothetical protein
MTLPRYSAGEDKVRNVSDQSEAEMRRRETREALTLALLLHDARRNRKPTVAGARVISVIAIACLQSPSPNKHKAA